MPIRWLLLAPFVTALIACTPLKLAEPNAPKKPAAPVAEADEGDDEAKSEETKPEKKKSDKKKKKAFHWKGYAGPKVPTTITTKMAWAVVPVGLDGDFGIAKAALLEYVKPEGDEHLLKVFGDDTIYVPQAMVQPAVPAKVSVKGTALFVNVAAASGYGRMTDLIKGTGTELDRVKVSYEWAGKVSDVELPVDQVIVLEDKVAFGHPVSYPVAADREVGTVVYTDKDTTWILSGTGMVLKLATKDVKPMKVSKLLKPGYSAFAPAPIQLKSGKITDVLDGGVRYKFKADAGGEERTLPFQLVSLP